MPFDTSRSRRTARSCRPRAIPLWRYPAAAHPLSARLRACRRSAYAVFIACLAPASRRRPSFDGRPHLCRELANRTGRPSGRHVPSVWGRGAPIDGEPLESNLNGLPAGSDLCGRSTTLTSARTTLCGPDRDLAGATSLKSSPTASMGFGSVPHPGLRTRNTPDLTARFIVTPDGRRACRSGPGASRAVRAGEGPPYPRRARHSPPAGRRSPAPRSGRFRPWAWRARGRRRHGSNTRVRTRVLFWPSIDRARRPSASSGERRLRRPPGSPANVPSLLEVSVHPPRHAWPVRATPPRLARPTTTCPSTGTLGLALVCRGLRVWLPPGPIPAVAMFAAGASGKPVSGGECRSI